MIHVSFKSYMYVVLSRYYASDKMHEACGTLTFLLFINAKVFFIYFYYFINDKVCRYKFLKKRKKTLKYLRVTSGNRCAALNCFCHVAPIDVFSQVLKHAGSHRAVIVFIFITAKSLEMFF